MFNRYFITDEQVLREAGDRMATADGRSQAT